jgi:hypothetical protein
LNPTDSSNEISAQSDLNPTDSSNEIPAPRNLAVTTAKESADRLEAAHNRTLELRELAKSKVVGTPEYERIWCEMRDSTDNESTIVANAEWDNNVSEDDQEDDQEDFAAQVESLKNYWTEHNSNGEFYKGLPTPHPDDSDFCERLLKGQEPSLDNQSEEAASDAPVPEKEPSEEE